MSKKNTKHEMIQPELALEQEVAVQAFVLDPPRPEPAATPEISAKLTQLIPKAFGKAKYDH